MEGVERVFAAADAVDEGEVRRQGIGLVDGTVPGYALLLGDDGAAAADVARALAGRQILTFVAEEPLVEALRASGVALGWESRVVPLEGADALAFVARMAQVFGNASDQEAALAYARRRLRGFTLLLGQPTPDRLATARAALAFGCPLVSTADLSPLDEGWDEEEMGYRAVVGGLPPGDLVPTAIEERGLRIHVPVPELPVEHGPDFCGEVVREGPTLRGVELVVMGEGLTDGHVAVVGPDLGEIAGEQPFGLLIEVSGRAMQPDFEGVLERQIETMVNELHGVMHRGQRAAVTLRVAPRAVEQGLRMIHLGRFLHARFHQEFGNILSRVQVTVLTDPARVAELAARAAEVYARRDARLQGLTDEAVDTFYTCTLCQSIAATHICIISPEHPGVCGAQDWLDTRAAVSIRPVGPNRPVPKEGPIDPRLGRWESVDRVVQQETGGAIQAYSLYSMMQDPGPSCGDFECITAMLPMANGVMVVDREYRGPTPSGMDWDSLYELVGSGLPVPGFIGHSKRLLRSAKYIAAEGGWRRIVWMPRALREEMRPALEALAAEAGMPGFVDKIATEDDALSEEEVLAHMERVKHPALGLEPLM